MSKVREKNENKLKIFLNGNDKPTTGSTGHGRPKPQANKGNANKR
jgi:hypothetical protein